MKTAVLTAVVLTFAVAGVSADEPAPEATANLARNPGFDTPPENAEQEVADQWGIWSSKNRRSRTSKAAFLSGEQSLEFTAQKDKDACDCIIQEHDVLPGKTYTFSVNLRNDPVAPLTGGAYGFLGIEWLDENGTEIKRDASTRWDINLSRMRWTTHKISGTAPRNAARAKFVITFSDGQPAGTGQCYADDAVITEQ